MWHIMLKKKYVYVSLRDESSTVYHNEIQLMLTPFHFYLNNFQKFSNSSYNSTSFYSFSWYIFYIFRMFTLFGFSEMIINSIGPYKCISNKYMNDLFFMKNNFFYYTQHRCYACVDAKENNKNIYFSSWLTPLFN